MIIFHLFTVVDRVISNGGWILILFADLFLRTVPPFSHRMRRGKYSRWVFKKFGLFGDLPIRMPLAAGMLAGSLATSGYFFVDVFYIFLAVITIVDWITGSDDPPWRKLEAAANKLLERIKPMPEPVVNV